jgi:type I restriction-modification system DNA methylase subunit
LPNFAELGKNGMNFNKSTTTINKMPTYTCDKCFKEFARKSGYDSHMERKNACKPAKAIEKVIEEKAVEIAKSLSEDVIALPEDEDQRKLVLQKFFEDLHNLLWSSAGLSPEKALDHMTFFFAYRLLEEQADTLGLPSVCRWSHIASIKDEHDLFEKVKKGYVEFKKNAITTHFFKQPEISKAMVVYNVVKLINKLPLKAIQESDTLGAIFEYMLGRGMSSMSDEGQYFTNRKICELAFELAYSIKKTIRRPDGSLNTFADWFCGTGGFPAEFVKGVAHKAAESGESIDWAIDSKSIYCQDMSLSSVSTTLLNMLILTGTLFSSANIRGGNSFTDQITIGASAPFKNVTIDYCFMNPPYGGDKTKGKEYKFAYAKGKGASKVYLVNQEIQTIGIEDDDKVSAGVQLAMATLSRDGVCAIVLPQGFFFGASKKDVELRKKIAEEYKIHYVVDIASGAFVNTGTKTSMLVFQKGGVTESVKFMDMNEKVLVEASLEDIRKKNYSLNYKQYLAQEAVEMEGFEMVKLGDIIEKVKGGKTNSTEISNTGDYDFYGCTANVPTGRHNKYDFEGDEYFLFAKSGGNAKTKVGQNLGIGKFHYVTGKTAGNIAVYQYKIRDTTKVSYRYLYHILRSKLYDIQMLADYTTGNGNINIENMYSINIPVPSLERQQQIVEAIDGWMTLTHQEEQALKTLEKQVMFQVKEMGRGKERVKLGDVCNINSGEAFRKEDIISGDVPVIGGGKIVGYHNKSNRPGNEFSITRVGDCNLNWFYTPFMLTEHGFSITLKEDDNSNALLKCIFYHLQNVKEDVVQLYDGTAQKLTTKTKLRDFTVPKFDVSELSEIASDFDEIRHKHAKIAYYKAKAADAIKRLIPGAE